MRQEHRPDICECCEGIEILTPMEIANRPGLPALAYRIGTHGGFLETMKARLSTISIDNSEGPGPNKLYPLRSLTTRQSDDFSIALLDAWATVADVLTFYQERIANEGYLRTAVERRSILELANLVGYRLRPGVAASVFLAFEMDRDQDVEIPKGTRSQSMPEPPELPQPFETSESLQARYVWNAISPRMKRPQYISLDNVGLVQRIYVDGITTNLGPNDPLIFVFDEDQGHQKFHFVKRVETSINLISGDQYTVAEVQAAPVTGVNIKAIIDEIATVAKRYSRARQYTVRPDGVMARRAINQLDRLQNLHDHYHRDLNYPAIKVAVEELRAERDLAVAADYDNLKRWLGAMLADLEPEASRFTEYFEDNQDGVVAADPFPFLNLAEPLSVAPSVQPRDRTRLTRSREALFSEKADVFPAMVTSLKPEIKDSLYTAWANAESAVPLEVESVFAPRVKASVFGHSATCQPDLHSETGAFLGWDGDWDLESPDQQNVLALDAEYDAILPGSWVLIDRSQYGADNPKVFRVEKVRSVSKAAYNLTGKVTELTLNDKWILDSEIPDPPADGSELSSEKRLKLTAVRDTTIYAQSEELALAEEIIEEDVKSASIELDGLYEGLEPGRWVIVAGERTDIENSTGVMDGELAMISSVVQEVNEVPAAYDPAQLIPRPGDKSHSTIILANKLAYTYKRDTVKIYANVVKATHGETRQEILGSGDSSTSHQSFTLNQSPLTYVAAPTPEGIESTLSVLVNDVRWREARSLVELGANDRQFITHTDNKDKTTIVTGDGRNGARLPSGPENIRAEYRSGIGQAGNVTKEKIAMLITRPAGVKGVINPLRASGGAGRENRDQARRNAPLAIMALDRVVSTQDYADFSRTFAGIAKASAREIPFGRQEFIHITIAGINDIPIDKNSDLYLNLSLSLRRFGDPYRPFRIDIRELILLVVGARVRVLPDYRWEAVEPQIREAMLQTFSFERRDLGQDTHLSEVMATIQRVPGVAYVDVDWLEGLSENEVRDPVALGQKIVALQGNGEINQRISVSMASRESGQILPAQLAYITPDVGDTLVLTEIS